NNVLFARSNVCFWHKADVPTHLVNVRFREYPRSQSSLRADLLPIADRIYPQNGCTRVAGLFCHAQQNRLTVLERPKARGIGPTWSALVQVTTLVALDCAGG